MFLMPEIDLYLKGKLPKVFCYIDEENQQFIELNCKLKEEISEFDIKKFFNMIYKAQLDNGYENIFKEKYNTYDLIICLKNILKEDKVINLEALYNILNHGEEINLKPILQILGDFFNMFEFSQKYDKCFSLKELNSMINYITIYPTFIEENSLFYKEYQSLTYNNALLERAKLETNKLGYEKGNLKQKRKTQTLSKAS